VTEHENDRPDDLTEDLTADLGEHLTVGPAAYEAFGAPAAPPPPAPAVAPAPVVSDLFRRRVTMAVTGAFVLGGVLAGSAVAIGLHRSSTGSPTTSVITEGWPGQNGSTQGGSQGGSQGGYGGQGYSFTPPSGGGGSDPFGGQFGSRFGNFGSGGAGATAETASDATAAQSVGLVEITSTLPDGKAAGTGIIWSSDGLVVTNHHVVAGATSVQVTVVSTGKTYSATYVGGDATADVAVIRLDGASGLTPATLSTNAAQDGDTITSVGDAGGNGGSLTASPGTVQGVDQKITVQDDGGGSSTLTGLIEMAAYVVPGDSGGAVFDKSGQVVGMNVAASSGGQTVTGYAIPIATVRSVAQEIIGGQASSQVQLGYHGYLGIGLSPTSTTPIVVQVERGDAAAKAGVVVGDTITTVDGTAVKTVAQLRAAIAKTEPGDTVTLGWRTSGGKSRSATVTLGQAPIG
jgi:S1-C subfamily serine protease